MAFDLTVTAGNILTLIGFIVGGVLAALAVKTQIALLAQRVGMAEKAVADTQDIAARIAEMKIKVDTMWEFSLRRAKGELIAGGLGTMNSPIKINSTATELMAALAGPLREFYGSLPGDLPESELALKIERAFGERLLREVCIPHKLSFGACLIIALHVAKGSEGAVPNGTLPA